MFRRVRRKRNSSQGGELEQEETKTKDACSEHPFSLWLAALVLQDEMKRRSTIIERFYALSPNSQLGTVGLVPRP